MFCLLVCFYTWSMACALNRLFKQNLKLSSEIVPDSSKSPKNAKQNRCVKTEPFPKSPECRGTSVRTPPALFTCHSIHRYTFVVSSGSASQGSHRFNSTHTQNPSVTCAKWINPLPQSCSLLMKLWTAPKQRQPCLEKSFSAWQEATKLLNDGESSQRRVSALRIGIIPYYIRHASAALLSVSMQPCVDTPPALQEENKISNRAWRFHFVLSPLSGLQGYSDISVWRYTLDKDISSQVSSEMTLYQTGTVCLHITGRLKVH